MKRTRTAALAVLAAATGWLAAAVPVYAAVPAAAAPAALHWHDHLEPALAEAAAGNRLVLVDLYADWCGWCKKLEAEVFTSPRFREEAARRFVLLRVNVEDGGEGTRLQLRFADGSLPTTLILAPGPVRVGTVAGFHPVDRFLLRVDTEIARWQELLAIYERALAGEDMKTLRSVAEELRQRGDGARAAAGYRRLLAPGREPEGGRGWLLLLLADSLRLERNFASAEQVVADGRKAAATAADGDLAEALELLSVRLARDRGDCQRAATAAEEFLSEHPKSRYAAGARSALQEVRSGGVTGCT